MDDVSAARDQFTRPRLTSHHQDEQPNALVPHVEPREEAADALSQGAADSVRLYLQEIGETDLLTMQEEVWLAKRMERGQLAASASRSDSTRATKCGSN